MLSWPNMKRNVDWILCDRKHSRPIWSTMWISWDDRGWCHDLILGDILIGTDDNLWCHDQILRAMWIGKDVTGSCHVQFEVLCGLEQMIEDDFMT
jgi:hypothetical protein